MNPAPAADFNPLCDIETILADAKAGRMFILVDDEDRENEGDLVIPAQMADAQAINFMAKFGRGLICLAMQQQHIRKLGLPPMARHNSSRHQTAFTVSIEAREGVTTGISAADRAHTIAVAIDPKSTPIDIASPGHVFPLEAREGGVLVRAGHTEAAVDISRMAGLLPAGVICEIMNDDGSMARLPDLVEFARSHQLHIGTIADLIAYRRRNEKLVNRQSSAPLHTAYGEFMLHLYVPSLGYAEHLALVKGDVSKAEAPLVRMHTLNPLADLLLDKADAKSGELQQALRMIDTAGCGAVVILREPRPTALSELLAARQNPTNAGSSSLRDYGIGAQILIDLGIRRLTLLSNSPQRSIIGLEGYGLEIAAQRAITLDDTHPL